MSTDDLTEALRIAGQARTFADPSNRERAIVVLADEVDRLRAEAERLLGLKNDYHAQYVYAVDARVHAAAERDAARAALGRVRAVHQSLPNSTSALHPEPLCSCDAIYPCETAQALEGES